MCHQIHGLVTLVAVELTVIYLASGLPQSLLSPECQQTCGDVGIPYPFEITAGCGLPEYVLNCTSGSTLSLTINSTQMEVLEISAGALIVHVQGLKANSCADAVGGVSIGSSAPYAISGGNRFYVTGCNASGSFTTDYAEEVGSCHTICYLNQSSSPFCEASGCCTVNIPSGSRRLSLQSQASANSAVGCGYASVIYPPSYNATHQSVTKGGIQLLWAITGGTCADATTLPGYACSASATCVDVEDVPGYICECNKHGYAGDGYFHGSGCLDINECAELAANRCSPDADCINTLGSYTCHCLEGFNGDGYVDGSGCVARKAKFSQTILLAAAFLISIGSAIFWRLRTNHLEAK
ncbi:hypothetical protein O6H91_15G082400 [Diphasiastrum complanatum]|uniref:Uncharacterized protein n=1 Tax=Diphasiastrum complanatum TaxID=34168 RepID=A0ACC2BKA1_DIPCM|nr:hypothetical protein O6H91_15G082400 [Diphasiastrum complanatum]